MLNRSALGVFAVTCLLIAVAVWATSTSPTPVAMVVQPPTPFPAFQIKYDEIVTSCVLLLLGQVARWARKAANALHLVPLLQADLQRHFAEATHRDEKIRELTERLNEISKRMT